MNKRTNLFFSLSLLSLIVATGAYAKTGYLAFLEPEDGATFCAAATEGKGSYSACGATNKLNKLHADLADKVAETAKKHPDLKYVCGGLCGRMDKGNELHAWILVDATDFKMGGQKRLELRCKDGSVGGTLFRDLLVNWTDSPISLDIIADRDVVNEPGRACQPNPEYAANKHTKSVITEEESSIIFVTGGPTPTPPPGDAEDAGTPTSGGHADDYLDAGVAAD